MSHLLPQRRGITPDTPFLSPADRCVYFGGRRLSLASGSIGGLVGANGPYTSAALRTKDAGVSWAGQTSNAVFTLVIQCVPTALSAAASNFAGFSRTSDGNGFIGLQTGNGLAAEFSFLSNTTRTNTGVAYDVGKTYNIVITGRRSGSASADLRIFINGLKVADNTAGFPSGAFSVGSALTLGATGAGCQTSLVTAQRRSVSDAEGVALSLLPKMMITLAPRRLFVPSAGGGSTLNASASGAVAASGAGSLAAQVALAGVGVSTAAGSAAATAIIPLSATGLTVASGTANAQATVTISAAGLAQAAAQAGLSASVLLAGAGAATAAGNATLAAQLNALASGAAQASGTANLSGGAPGALNAAGQTQADGSAVLSVNINLAAAGAAQASGTAAGTASAPGALSAAGAAQAGGAATWSTLITLTAAGFVQAMGAGAFSAQVPLSASGQASAGGQAGASLVGQVHHFRLAATVARKTALQLSVRRTTTLHHEVRHA